jgi:cardiolipin synthase A/B
MFLFFSLLLSVLILGGGCATLPNVTETMRDVPADQEPRQIGSANGLLSSKQSKALMKRLEESVKATDMMERYTAVIESVSNSPLTKGNKVTLLVDGPATYAAMFKAVENAKEHINIETYTMEDIEDETGRKFADLL